MLINAKMSIIVDVLTFMSLIKFMSSLVVHGKSFITPIMQLNIFSRHLRFSLKQNKPFFISCKSSATGRFAKNVQTFTLVRPYTKADYLRKIQEDIISRNVARILRETLHSRKFKAEINNNRNSHKYFSSKLFPC